ncbi:MAG: alpha/beta hydrolase [Phenylobacterium sp.]|nr:alpha/beta hydrolase [Phenylobacterium sp.]
MFDSDGRSPEEIVARLEAQAERYETPCGDGVMAWRAWGEGPPLVLLHGAHGAWTHWIRNIEALRQVRRVVAADIPGFGDSARPPRPEDVRSFAEVIAEGLGRLPLETPLDVVGFSTGGVMAAYLAGLAPELVRRLILVDTGGLGTPLGAVESAPIRGLQGEALREAHRVNLLGIMLHAEAAADDLAIHVQAQNAPRGRVSPRPLVMPDKLLLALPQVRAQVDVIWGARDRAHADPQSQMAVVRRFQPDAELRVIPDAGHWSMYENAEAFNAELLDLLAQPLRPR